MTDRCAIAGCAIETEAGRLFCLRHHRLIPLALRETIQRLYANGKPRAGYEEAVANAIEQVTERIAVRTGT